MKLDVNAMRYLTRDDFRVLTAVEMGMKNHEIVPVPLLTQIAALRLGGVGKIVSTLLQCKLLHHEQQHCDGYRLTYLGYDFLAIRTFLARGTIAGVGRQIGVGKESDIFIVQNEDEEEFCLKLHRLGRTSFRAIKNKRDYHKNRGSPSWLYLSRLAAMKENTFMKILHEYGFPVPTPVDGSRHALLMSLVDGYPLNQVRVIDDPERVYTEMMELIERFAKHGLIHGDFNEFNVMISDSGVLTVIDFPQMVSTRHPNARMYFERDVNCVRRFFRKRFNFFHEMKPNFDECIADKVADLDVQVSASGFTNKMKKDLDRFIETQAQRDEMDSGSEEESETESDSEEEGETGDEDSEEEDEEANVDEDGQVPAEGEKKEVSTVSPDSTCADENSSPIANQVASSSADAGESADGTSAGAGVGADANAGSEVEGDSDAESDTVSLGDGPQAYLAHDYASAATTRSRAPGMDDIRRRARRDFTRKSKVHQKGKTGKRNTVKSKIKQQLRAEVRDEQ